MFGMIRLAVLVCRPAKDRPESDQRWTVGVESFQQIGWAVLLSSAISAVTVRKEWRRLERNRAPREDKEGQPHELGDFPSQVQQVVVPKRRTT